MWTLRMLDRRYFKSDRGNPMLPVLLGLVAALGDISDELLLENSPERTPLEDDVLLVALGLLRLKRSCDFWLGEGQTYPAAQDAVQEVSAVYGKLKR